jgi:hypothetical protein
MLPMKFMVLIYNDPALVSAMPAGQMEADLRACFDHCDELAREGHLLDSKMLASPATARSVRVRQGQRVVSDGPFMESKEMLGGFNLIEADDMDHALRIVAQFPWASSGCIEVRPVEDLEAVKLRVREAGAAHAG